MESTVIVRAILFNEENEVLLLRRSNTDTERQGEQDYPGGGVETSEDVTQALVREIFEEAGIRVSLQDLHLFYAKTELRYGKSATRMLFYARVINPVVKLSDEHDDYHWTSPEKAIIEFPHHFYSEGLKYGIKHKLFESE